MNGPVKATFFKDRQHDVWMETTQESWANVLNDIERREAAGEDLSFLDGIVLAAVIDDDSDEEELDR